MSILEAAKRDLAQIQANGNDYAVDATFKPLTGSNFTIKVIHTKHYLGVDTDGLPVNAKTASISFSESNLPDGVDIRNADNEVRMINWKVDVVDSSGVVAQYIIREHFPDEMLGTIVLILGDFQ